MTNRFTVGEMEENQVVPLNRDTDEKREREWERSRRRRHRGDFLVEDQVIDFQQFCLGVKMYLGRRTFPKEITSLRDKNRFRARCKPYKFDESCDRLMKDVLGEFMITSRWHFYVFTKSIMSKITEKSSGFFFYPCALSWENKAAKKERTN